MQTTYDLYSDSLGDYGHILHTKTVACHYLSIYVAPLRHWVSGPLEPLAGKKVAKPRGRFAQLFGPAGLAACIAVSADIIQAVAVSLLCRRIGGGLIVALARAHGSRSSFKCIRTLCTWTLIIEMVSLQYLYIQLLLQRIHC